MKHAPPGVDSTSIWPLCSSTMAWLMLKPRPVPLPGGLVVKKGSKILSRMPERYPARIDDLDHHVIGGEQVRTVTLPPPNMLRSHWRRG